MKNFKVECFGITRDIFGTNIVELEANETINVGELKAKLMAMAPTLKDLLSLNIAVNQEYAEDDLQLNERDEIVLIPPVSGG